MKPRARRITMAAAALGVGVVSLLVVAHWGTIRDHVEAWHFQLTKETRTVEPYPLEATVIFEQNADMYPIEAHVFLHVANFSRCPVIWDPEENLDPVSGGSFTGNITKLLEAQGFRVLEQRFPRRAYVVIRDEHAGQLDYVVQRGDTLFGIAKRFYGGATNLHLIEEKNPHLKYRVLRVGETIKVPALAPRGRAGFRRP